MAGFWVQLVARRHFRTVVNCEAPIGLRRQREGTANLDIAASIRVRLMQNAIWLTESDRCSERCISLGVHCGPMRSLRDCSGTASEPVRSGPLPDNDAPREPVVVRPRSVRRYGTRPTVRPGRLRCAHGRRPAADRAMRRAQIASGATKRDCWRRG